MILYENGSTKGNAEGTNFTINDTSNGRTLKFYKYEGQTTQTGTPTPSSPQPINVVTGNNTIDIVGKNLFDKDSSTLNKYLDTNGNLQNSSVSGVSDYINVTNINSVYLSYTGTNTGTKNVAYYDSNKTFQTYGSYTTSRAIDTTNYSYIRFTYVMADEDLVMLSSGTSEQPYEPYKSQIYSLNLGTIELCKIGNYVDEINKSSGKNLFDESTQSLNTLISNTGEITHNNYWNTSDYIEVKPNIQYTFSQKSSSTASGEKQSLGIVEYDANKTFIVRNLQGSSSTIIPYTRTMGSSTKYVRLIYNNSHSYYDNQFEQGTQTEYQPYGTSWYIKKNIGKVVLDGSENSWVKSGASSTDYFVASLALNNMGIYSKSGSGSLWLINRFSNGEGLGTSNNENCFYTYNPDTTWGYRNIGFTVSSSLVNDINSWKTWLDTHNLIVYYVLANPTYTVITDNELVEQLEALENATTYDNQTNVIQTNSGLPIYTYVEFIKPLDFSRNGLGVIPNVLNAKVVDEINGEYSLTFEYPMSEPMATELVEDRIVKCKVADGTEQCFIIKTIQKSFDKMSVYCTHLFYLLYDNFLEDTYPQNLSPKPFLDHILSRANYQLPFTTTSDISTTKTARYVRKNCVEAILGDIDNSMFNLFGMELKRDNWNIGLKARLGADKGEKLIFGKNITGIDVNIDTTGVYTRIMPIGFDGLLLPEKYVDADNIDEYPYPRICLYEFPDIVYDPEQEGAYHNLDDAYQALRDAVNELYANGINKPLINISVNWVELSNTEEYKQYSALERVDLGDTLTCNLFGMDYTTRVIKTEYNPLTDRIDTFEIGTFQPNIATSMNKVEFDVTQINPSSILEQAQENATSLITQAMGGYVYKTNSELYIMDNEDPNQAVHVWRWNINGLGYSSTGINGNYGLAMTMDGQIVADFITTGHLNTSVIEGYDSIVQQVYATDSDLQSYKGQVASQFTQTANTFEFQFNNLNTLIDSVSNTEYTHYQELNRYIRFVNGVIILGEEGNPFTVELSNTRLSFKQDGTEVAYVSNNKLYITSAEVIVNEKIGNFEFRPRNNGSLSFGKVSE